MIIYTGTELRGDLLPFFFSLTSIFFLLSLSPSCCGGKLSTSSNSGGYALFFFSLSHLYLFKSVIRFSRVFFCVCARVLHEPPQP